MNARFYLSALSMLLALHLSAQEVVSTSFSSSSLGGESIPLNIYLPEGYDADGDPYNLYIFLHGCCGLNHQSHINEFQARLDHLIGNGDISPLIVVFPSAQGADFGNRHMWFNSERNGQYSDLIAADLLDWLAAHYNVSEANRAIGGFSMGADGALRIGLKHPDLFVAAIGHSSFPALDFFPNLIPVLISETGQPAPPYDFAPTNGALSTQVYGAASAWSPNNDNPDFMLDFPVDADGLLIESVFARWKINADIDSIIRFQWGETKEVPLSIYFDAGANEAFLPPNALLDAQLNNLVGAEGYQINFKYLGFSGGHVMTEPKIDSSLLWLDGVFFNISTSSPEALGFDDDLSIYPNPTAGQLTIAFSSQAGMNYTIDVIDSSGRLVQREMIRDHGENRVNLEISKLVSGVYQVVVRDSAAKRVMAKRVVKI